MRHAPSGEIKRAENLCPWKIKQQVTLAAAALNLA